MAQKYRSIALDYRASPATAVAQVDDINTFMSDKKLIAWDLDNEFINAIYDTVLGGATASEFLAFKESADATIELAIESRTVIKHKFVDDARYLLVEAEKV